MILEKWELVPLSESVSNPMSYIYNEGDTINFIMKDICYHNKTNVIYTRIFYLRN